MMPLGIALALGLSKVAVAMVAHSRVQAGERQARARLKAPARFLRFPTFLGPRRAEEILHSTALRTPQLVPSTVTGNVADYQQSQLLWNGDVVAPDVVERVRTMAPEMARILRIAPAPFQAFTPGEIESQVTVSSDGDFFKEHDDNGCPDTAGRRLSWVYYLHREPRPFSGGELVMYGAAGPDGEPGAYVIEPANDTLVVFPSDCLHEVKRVSTPSRSPLDARVTVNGWVRAA